MYRAKLGRHVSHPHAIHVTADCGCVTLRGEILKREQKPLLRAVERIPGVSDVDDLLEAYESGDNIPSLQGGRPRLGEHYDVLQTNWSPATRTLLGSIGSALAAYGASRHDRAGKLACLTGAGLILRAATNLETTRLLGVSEGRRTIDIEKTIRIAAPVSRVFDFWTRLATFPHFMRNVLELRPANTEGQYHWRIAGSGRVPVEFDTVITRFEPNRVFAWKTLEGSAVAHAGVIYFEPDEAGGTRVHIQFSCNSPGGAIGRAIASLVGNNPEETMNEDLARMKTAIERPEALM